MKIRSALAVLALWFLVMAAGTAGAQQQLTQAGALVRQGDVLWLNNQQRPQVALDSYNQAYNLASQTSEAPILTILAERYLLLGYDNAAVTCYQAALVAAVAWMRAQPPDPAKYRYGFDALNHMINNWNYVLNRLWFGRPADPANGRPFPEPPRLTNTATRNALLNYAQQASNTVLRASQPAVVPPPQSTPPVLGGGGNPAGNCDPSVPNSCDIILTPRNPR